MKQKTSAFFTGTLIQTAAAVAILGLVGKAQAQLYFSAAGGPYTWGADNKWSSTTGGPYTESWGAWNDAIFEGTGGTVNVSGTQSVNGMTFNVDGYQFTGGTLQLGGASGGAPITVGTGLSATIQSDVLDTWTGMRKEGAGTLTLTGNVNLTTFSGAHPLTINAGTLAFAGASSSVQAHSVKIGNATLAVTSGTTTVNCDIATFENTAAINVSGGKLVATQITSVGNEGSGGSVTLNLSNNGEMTASNLYLAVRANTSVSVSNSSSLTADNLAFGWPGAGVQQGTGSITVTDTGSFTANSRFALGGLNQVTLNLNGGTFTTTAFDRAGSGGTVTLNFNGGTLKSNGSAGGGALSNFLAGVDNAVVKSGGAMIDTNGSAITVTQALTDGGGGGGLTKSGSGTLTLTQAPGFSGGITVSGGQLTIDSGGSYASGAFHISNGTLEIPSSDYRGVEISNGVNIAFDSAGGGVFKLGSGVNFYTWSGLSYQISSAGGGQNRIDGGGVDGGMNYNGKTAAFDVARGTDTISDLKVFSAIANTNGGLTKTGNGILELAGVNTYTGATQVNQGTLLVNGSTTSGSAVTVASGATLGGIGTVGGATTIQSGGHLAVGTSPGTQTFSSTLTFESGSIFDWELNADTADTGSGNQGTYDKVVANGAVSGTSVFTIALGTNAYTDAFWDTNKSWSDIFTGSGSPDLTSIFTTINGTGISWNSENSRGNVDGQGYFTMETGSLNWTAVPEPTTALAGLLLTAGLLRRRRVG